MRVEFDINGARVTITGDRLQVSVAEEESRAKASEDNGATGPDEKALAECVTGEASRQRQRRRDGGERPAPIPEKIKLAPITVLRPNCLSPDSCAGHGRNHCHRCRKVLAEGEAA